MSFFLGLFSNQQAHGVNGFDKTTFDLSYYGLRAPINQSYCVWPGVTCDEYGRHHVTCARIADHYCFSPSHSLFFNRLLEVSPAPMPKATCDRF